MTIPAERCRDGVLMTKSCVVCKRARRTGAGALTDREREDMIKLITDTLDLDRIYEDGLTEAIRDAAETVAHPAWCSVHEPEDHVCDCALGKLYDAILALKSWSQKGDNHE